MGLMLVWGQPRPWHSHHSGSILLHSQRVKSPTVRTLKRTSDLTLDALVSRVKG